MAIIATLLWTKTSQGTERETSLLLPARSTAYHIKATDLLT